MWTPVPIPVTADTVVDDLMTAHRRTIAVFLRHRMMCVGCPVGGIHDVRQACEEHGVSLDAFLAEVNEAVAAGG